MNARQGSENARLVAAEIEKYCPLDDSGRTLLKGAIRQLGLSGRAYHRVLKVARTIADLAGENRILAAHLAEAVQYRRLDRGP
jgi:magnesium chelatase family protein